MNELFKAAKEVADFMRARQWKFCIIGGLAVQRWGEPRATRDVDLTLLTGFADEETFCQTLLDRFPGRTPDARELALHRRVLLLNASNGAAVDISFAGLPYEERLLARASDFLFKEDLVLKTCSAEDLVVLKAFASRQQDWLDIEGVAIRQGAQLNWRLIMKEIAPLAEAKDAPEIVVRLRKLAKR